MSQLPKIYRNYLLAFLLSLPIGIAALALPGVEIIYALVFFVSSISVVFSRESFPAAVPEHSTIEHFEVRSRWNWYNYVPALLLAVYALAYMFLELNHTLIILLGWIINILIIIFIMPKAQDLLWQGIIGEYLAKRMPEVKPSLIRQFVISKLQNTNVLIAELTPAQQDRLAELYAKYLENNKLDFTK